MFFSDYDLEQAEAFCKKCGAEIYELCDIDEKPVLLDREREEFWVTIDPVIPDIYNAYQLRARYKVHRCSGES